MYLDTFKSRYRSSHSCYRSSLHKSSLATRAAFIRALSLQKQPLWRGNATLPYRCCLAKRAVHYMSRTSWHQARSDKEILLYIEAKSVAEVCIHLYGVVLSIAPMFCTVADGQMCLPSSFYYTLQNLLWEPHTFRCMRADITCACSADHIEGEDLCMRKGKGKRENLT